MPNAEKISAVAEISEQFANASAAVITEYRGLTVKQVTQLRRALGRDTTYAVVKNTLTKRAAAEAGVPIDDSLLTGPTAIAFVKGDPVEAAKGLRDFAKTNPLLVIKGGVLEGKAAVGRRGRHASPTSSRARCCSPSSPAPSRRCRPARPACSRLRCRRWPAWPRPSRRRSPPETRRLPLLPSPWRTTPPRRTVDTAERHPPSHQPNAPAEPAE